MGTFFLPSDFRSIRAARVLAFGWFFLSCQGAALAQGLPQGGTFHSVPLRCIQTAAQRYGLRPNILFAILRTENGRPGTVSPDPNGTDDLGPAQVNTCHLPFLSSYGYSFRTLADNPCANIQASAWIFARCLATHRSVFSAAACYNAGSHPQYAWASGYVSRFARYLGVPVVVRPKPKYWGMGLTVIH